MKTPLPPAHWPTAEAALASRLFSPRAIGPHEARGRSWVPAMVPWRASDDGFVTDDVIRWYGRFADGRPAVLVVEATGIRDVASGPLLRIGDDRFIRGLERLTAEVRRRSGGETLLFLQILDFLAIRRRPERAKFLSRFLVVTDPLRERAARALGDPTLSTAADETVRARLVALSDAESDALLPDILPPRELQSLRMGYRERVTDTDLPQVEELPRVLPPLFAAAARRAAEAGFHGVELHYAHAYTMASFLSATNTRADGFGGSRDDRLRLPLDVYRAVRSAVPATCAVGCRMLADEAIDGGTKVGEAAWFAERFAAAGMDFISLSRGGKFEDPGHPEGERGKWH